MVSGQRVFIPYFWTSGTGLSDRAGPCERRSAITSDGSATSRAANGRSLPFDETRKIRRVSPWSGRKQQPVSWHSSLTMRTGSGSGRTNRPGGTGSAAPRFSSTTPPAVSCSTNEPAATQSHATTGDNIAKNLAAIPQWLSSAATGKNKAFDNVMDGAGGKIYLKASDTFVSPKKVVTVLKRRATAPTTS